MNWRNNRRSGWKIGKQSSRRLEDINLCNWAESLFAKKLFFSRRRGKKVNLKWHVNVMRSHVKWCFLSTDTALRKRKWEKCWDDYQSTLISCEFIMSLFMSLPFFHIEKLKSFTFLTLRDYRRWTQHKVSSMQQLRENVLKLNHSPCISDINPPILFIPEWKLIKHK